MSNILGCNILLDCVMCGTILTEILPVRNSFYKESGGKESISKVDVNKGAIEIVLNKNNWRKLLSGGYICENCYDKLVELHNIKPSEIKSLGKIGVI